MIAEDRLKVPRRLTLLPLVVAAAMAILACSGNGQTPRSTPTKGPMRGLLDMGDISFYTSPSAVPTNDPSEVQLFARSFAGIVINASWAQLQPVEGAPLARNNPIDQALQAVELYNSKNPNTHLLVKLRVWGGLTAPDWVKSQAVCQGTSGSIDVTTSIRTTFSKPELQADGGPLPTPALISWPAGCVRPRSDTAPITTFGSSANFRWIILQFPKASRLSA